MLLTLPEAEPPIRAEVSLVSHSIGKLAGITTRKSFTAVICGVELSYTVKVFID